MNTVKSFFGAAAIAASAPFAASADGHTPHDFTIKAENFRPGASRFTTPSDVSVFCEEDFDWTTTPPRPTPQLIERMDSEGWAGGEQSNIAFLLMSADEQEVAYNDMAKNVANGFRNMVQRYNNSPDKIRHMMDLIFINHEWNPRKFDDISGHCYNEGHAPQGYAPD